MTYLQLVNMVLRRLRENEVTTLQGISRQTSYVRLIGDFINDAKRMVEQSWDWSALRTTQTVTTQADVFNYVLTGSNTRFEVLNVLNDTSNWFMHYQTASWFDQAYLLDGAVNTGSHAYYRFNCVDANGDTQVDVYPKPDGVYTLRFNVVQRRPDLSADTDTVIVPSRPIVLLAQAMAIEERGEDGGNASTWAYQQAQAALSDEIALDSARHPEELIWREV
jgi:hypothetical protein